MKLRNAIKSLFGGIFLRMAIMFLVVLVFSSAIVLFFMNNVFHEKSFEEILRSQSYSVRQMINGLDAYMDGIDQLTMRIVYDSNVQNLLQGRDPGRYNINALLGSYARQENLYIMLRDGYGNVYGSSNIPAPRNSLERFEETELYSAMQKSYAALNWDLCISDMLTTQVNVDEKWMLTAARRVRHLELDPPAGCIVVQVFPWALAAQMGDPLMHSDARYLLLDSANRVAYDSSHEFSVSEAFSDSTLLERMAAGESSFFGETSLGNQLYVFGETKKGGMRIVSCLPDEEVFGTPSDLFTMLLRATAMGMVIALILALSFSLYLSRPIMEIVLAMRRVRNGDFGVRVKPRHSDEVGELAYTFNVMTDDMGKLMEQTKRDQRDLKSAEFKALIYQINPHFIYNTLDNINMLARMSEDKRMSMMITELSSLLRITLSGGQEVVPVKRELKHVSNYLRIMQLRNEEMFSYEVRCQEGLEEISVLKVILQPIAENAIQHGLEFVEEDGFLRVSALSEGSSLVLRVEDNGIGMDQYDANRLLERLEKDQPMDDDTRGIGLRNVWHRLRIYYGENGFRMRFKPSDLGGLMVEIVLYNRFC